MLMEKRADKRIDADIATRFYCRGVLYAGNITNLSEKGLFISMEEVCLSSGLPFEVFIENNGNTISVPAYIKRIVMVPDSSNGIGVEISDPSEEYIGFVNSLRMV